MKGSRGYEVGERVKWFGVYPVPQGASWNPPPPGWIPPTAEELAVRKRIRCNAHAVVIGVSDDAKAMRLRFDDGFEFDVADWRCVVPASYDGWERPCRCSKPMPNNKAKCLRCCGRVA